MYIQADPQWSGIHLGSSNYTMGRYGCVTTCLAIAFSLAGYPYTPADVVNALNANSGYTDAKYKYGPGLLIWGNIVRSFPQWHWAFGGEWPYKLVQLKTKFGEHWVLYFNGQYYDPATGSIGALNPDYTQTGEVISVNIDPPAAPPTPPDPAPPVDPPADIAQPFWVQTTANLNVRDEPSTIDTDGDVSTLAPAFRLLKGDKVLCEAYVDKQQYNITDNAGNVIGVSTKWCKSANHHLYFAAAYTQTTTAP